MPVKKEAEKTASIKKEQKAAVATKAKSVAEKKTPNVSNKSTAVPKKVTAVSTKSPKENKSEKREIVFEPIKEKKHYEIDLSEDFNNSTIFDVYFYRELFMELRKLMDDLYSKRGKGDKEYTEYDEAVYNITANAVSDCGAQDFMGYCYKKGVFDFCIMNYEKYMKWTILAAANGNAFSISKLQIYLTTAVDKIFEVENQQNLVDFLDLSGENYIYFLSKMICEEIVELLEISAEKLIKMPEKFMEQNEEVQKIFDKVKIEAAEKVCLKVKNAVDQLEAQIEEEQKQKQLLKEEKKAKADIETKKLETETEQAAVEEESKKEPEKENKFRRPVNIKKKFRY